MNGEKTNETDKQVASSSTTTTTTTASTVASYSENELSKNKIESKSELPQDTPSPTTPILPEQQPLPPTEQQQPPPSEQQQPPPSEQQQPPPPSQPSTTQPSPNPARNPFARGGRFTQGFSGFRKNFNKNIQELRTNPAVARIQVVATNAAASAAANVATAFPPRPTPGGENNGGGETGGGNVKGDDSLSSSSEGEETKSDKETSNSIPEPPIATATIAPKDPPPPPPNNPRPFFRQLSSSHFRGRYNTTPPSPPKKTPLTPSQSQTALILASPAASHYQSILASLSPGNYPLLLGPGLMGVNLKQSFLIHRGVYVDYLIPKGAADKSGVVGVGDVLERVGEVDVSSGTIRSVPIVIAEAKRPVVVVLMREFDVSGEEEVDVAVGMALKVMEEEDDVVGGDNVADVTEGSDEQIIENRGDVVESEDKEIKETNEPGNDEMTASSDKPADDDENKDNNDDEEGDKTETEKTEKDTASTAPKEKNPEETALTSPTPSLKPSFSIDDLPPPPTKPIRDTLATYAIKSNLSIPSPTSLSHAISTTPLYRTILRAAFKVCTIDPRRFPFLAAHCSLKDDEDEELGLLMSSSKSSLLLLLYLDVLSFEELYEVMPIWGRVEHVGRMRKKYWGSSEGGEEEEEEKEEEVAFDLRGVVDEKYRPVIEDDATTPSKNIFNKLRVFIEQSLLETRITSFLVGDDCARMRAYLRGTAPYFSLSLHQLFERVTSQKGGGNALLYHVMHALLEVDASETKSGCTGITGGLCAVVGLRRGVLRLFETMERMEGEEEKMTVGRELLHCIEWLWEVFLVEKGGLLDDIIMSENCREAWSKVRDCLDILTSSSSHNISSLISTIINTPSLPPLLTTLSQELLYDYAVNIHPRFKADILHESLCNEIWTFGMENEDYNMSKEGSFVLPDGCVSRLMRAVELPAGVSLHKTVRDDDTPTTTKKTTSVPHAEYAVVFGTDDSETTASTPSHPVITMDHCTMRRFATVALGDELTLKEGEIPSTLESYAVVGPFRERATDRNDRLKDTFRVSDDGWEVTLFDFTIPSNSTTIYAVSLVFHQSEMEKISQTVNKNPQHNSPSPPIELIHNSDTPSPSPKTIHTPIPTPNFTHELNSTLWSDTNRRGGNTLGIVLLSSHPVIPAMRSTLIQLLDTHSRDLHHSTLSSPTIGPRVVQPLIHILGTLSQKSVENESLRYILAPHLQSATQIYHSKNQSHLYLQRAGRQLLQYLPPHPLSLLLLSTLLEHKITIVSSRRSSLLAVTTAITKLIHPLEWPHLLVPLVPSRLALDLVNYPAPFIVGVVRDHDGVEELLSGLPKDVTVVDLDVGRVELAEWLLGDKGGERSLRSQMMHLGDTLGEVLGTRLLREAWCCDGPLFEDGEGKREDNGFEVVVDVCKEFVVELLAGTSSCCYWIEESYENDHNAQNVQRMQSQGECSVLFDEDRFFHIKNLRAQGRLTPLLPENILQSLSKGEKDDDDNEGVAEAPLTASTSLALSLDDFDLVFETFLRSQAMSTYISTRPKNKMIYW